MKNLENYVKDFIKYGFELKYKDICICSFHRKAVEKTIFQVINEKTKKIMHFDTPEEAATEFVSSVRNNYVEI